jgi:hypothetical protein
VANADEEAELEPSSSAASPLAKAGLTMSTHSESFSQGTSKHGRVVVVVVAVNVVALVVEVAVVVVVVRDVVVVVSTQLPQRTKHLALNTTPMSPAAAQYL